MEIKNQDIAEYKKMSREQLREAEKELRHKVVDIKMNHIMTSSKDIGYKRTLKKNIARLLTFKNENIKNK